MKVGDYVRLKNGYIDKIEELKLQTKYTKYHKLLFEHKVVECLFSDEDLKQLKSSPNIIDLIEVGDYVNGYYVEDIRRRYDDGIIVMLECATGSNHFQAPMYNEDIKSIVTHEQFERMQYNLESQV